MTAAAISATSPIEVDDIYATCQRLMDGGVTINRPPRDGHMAFVRSPDGISVELLQKGERARARRALGVDAQHGRMVMARLSVSAVPVLTDNYVWLIHDPDSGETAAVDPSVDASPCSKPRCAGLADRPGAEHPLASRSHRRQSWRSRTATGCTITAPAEAERVSKIDRIVAEGDRVTVGGAEAMVWDIPAHTAGHIAYYFEDERMIFVGDTMFAMGCGRLFEGTAEQMYANMQRIAALPDEVRIYCGHEYTLANARFAAHVEPDNAAVGERLERVIALREREDHASHDRCRGARHQPLRSRFRCRGIRAPACGERQLPLISAGAVE